MDVSLKSWNLVMFILKTDCKLNYKWQLWNRSTPSGGMNRNTPLWGVASCTCSRPYVTPHCLWSLQLANGNDNWTRLYGMCWVMTVLQSITKTTSNLLMTVQWYWASSATTTSQHTVRRWGSLQTGAKTEIYLSKNKKETIVDLRRNRDDRTWCSNSFHTHWCAD